MTPSYMTSSYNKISGKRANKPASNLAATTSVAGSQYGDAGTSRSPRQTVTRQTVTRQTSPRESVSRSSLNQATEGDAGMGRGRIEGPTISLGGDSDPWEKFLKEQQDIQKANTMLAYKNMEKALSDPNTYLRNYGDKLREGGMREEMVQRNIGSTRDAIQRENQARSYAIAMFGKRN